MDDEHELIDWAERLQQRSEDRAEQALVTTFCLVAGGLIFAGAIIWELCLGGGK
jgi:hypothetical protein